MEKEIPIYRVAEIIGVISHNIRGAEQPLVLMKDLIDDEMFRKAVFSVQNHIENIHNMIKDILKVRELNFKEVNLNKLLKKYFKNIEGNNVIVPCDEEKIDFVFNTLKKIFPDIENVKVYNVDKSVVLSFENITVKKDILERVDDLSFQNPYVDLAVSDKIIKRHSGNMEISYDRITIKLPFSPI